MSARRRPVLAACLSVAAALLAVEGLARVAPGAFGAEPADVEQLATYERRGALSALEARPYLNYARPRAAGLTNGHGYLDEPWSDEKPAGVARVACLGGSTTESGNDRAIAGAYPTLLEFGLDLAARRRRAALDLETLNFGVSGWTSAEVLLAWHFVARHLDPDVVVLHVGVNDVAPGLRADFRADYSHYRKPFDEPRPSLLERNLLLASRAALLLRARRGLPTLGDLADHPAGPLAATPTGLHRDAVRTFRRNVAAVVDDARSRGILVVLATEPLRPPGAAQADAARAWDTAARAYAQALRELAADRGCVLVDLAREAEEAPDAVRDYFLDPVHVSPEGNLWKAARIGEALLEAYPPLAARPR